MRTFIVDGTLFTTESYGKFILKKQYEESCGATQDPKLTKQQIENFGLATLQERMMEDESVYEVDRDGNMIPSDREERKRLIENNSQFVTMPPLDYSKLTNQQIELRTKIMESTFEMAFSEKDNEDDQDDI